MCISLQKKWNYSNTLQRNVHYIQISYFWDIKRKVYKKNETEVQNISSWGKFPFYKISFQIFILKLRLPVKGVKCYVYFAPENTLEQEVRMQ